MTSRIDLARTFDGLDVPWLLRQWSERTPRKSALVWEPFEGKRRVWTYRQLQDAVRRAAAGLHRHGVEPGDFVIIHLDNCPEFVITWYACARLGAVAVSTNTRSVARELKYFADHTSAVCAVTQPKYLSLVRDARPNLNFVVVTDNDAGTPTDTTGDGALPFAALTDDDAQPPDLPRDPMRNLGVQFTSGTTARPKAVLWTHANGLWAGRVSAAHTRLRRQDVCLLYLPLFHTNAQSYSMLATHWSGGTVVLQPEFDPARFWDAAVRNRATWCSMVSVAIRSLAGQAVPPRHRFRLWGTPARRSDIGNRYGIETLGWWGMTETITHGIVCDPDHPGPDGTIGRPAPEYQIQIRREDGSAARAGEAGNLFVRGVPGVSLFKEYYGHPDANDKAFDADGWFDTGDVIRSDENGWLYFSDRSKDMLKVGAENVAASEIESVIMKTGLVEECAVVGQRHHLLDEVPVAFVIPAPGAGRNIEERITRACREDLADFKVVRAVHVVEALPRSALDKIAKTTLRARLPAITTSGST